MFFGCKEHMPLCIYDNHAWVMGKRNAEIFKNRGLGAESLIFQVENELRYCINSWGQVNHTIRTDCCACAWIGVSLLVFRCYASCVFLVEHFLVR